MDFFRKSLGFLIVPMLSLATLTLFFQLWNVDLTKPLFSYSGDDFFSTFSAKLVIDGKWFLDNDFVGLPNQFHLYDFPLQADSFHFFILKILAYFSNNPFLLVNIFFILSFVLIALSSFIALRSFNITSFSAAMVSILYAFMPYHFSRNVSHLFLGNYAVAPLLVMVALWIIQDRTRLVCQDKNAKFAILPNRFFWGAFFISIFVAVNGIYYAFYGILIFIFAWFLRNFRHGNFLNRKFFDVAILCFATFFTLLVLYFPSIIYWAQHGFNQISVRGFYESDFYGFRIISLFLPVDGHHFEYLNNLRQHFDNDSPINGETKAESLGILTGSGFVFLLLWLIAKSQNGEKSFFNRTLEKFLLQKNEQNLISDLAGLNLLSVLFVSAGGLVMFFTISFPLLRSHARFSIFIAFFALFLIAIIFDKIIERKKILANFFITIAVLLALFDQIGKDAAARIQPQAIVQKYDNDQDFIQKIESVMPPKSMIFQLPFSYFPESGTTYELLRAYLNSKNLRWSYPAIKGREASNWQQKVVKLDFADFISEIKKAGFSGVYIDRYDFILKEQNWQELRALEKNLRAIAKEKPIASKDLGLIFFKI